MGLLMDSNGLPMAFNTFSGGESEKTSLLPVIRRVKRIIVWNGLLLLRIEGSIPVITLLSLPGPMMIIPAGMTAMSMDRAYYPPIRNSRHGYLNQMDTFIPRKQIRKGKKSFSPTNPGYMQKPSNWKTNRENAP
jgi:hypothetical protein